MRADLDDVSRPVRLAIVGSGNIAKIHSAAIEQIAEAQLVAVCSRNAETAHALAEPVGAQAVTDTAGLFRSDDIDAVLIATPSGCHAETAIPAMQAGKHVLCEKPLEVTTDRVRKMVQTAEEAGVVLAGFFPLRCGTGARAIREALDAKRFGELNFISARVKWWREDDYYTSRSWRGTWALDGGGALMNQGIHAVDLVQWLAGCPETVMAYAAKRVHKSIEGEDTLAATLRFSTGCLGTIEAATSCYPGLDFSIELSGDRGTAVLVNDRIETWKFMDKDPQDQAVLSGEGGGIRGGTSNPTAISYEGHRQQIEVFCKAIRGKAAATITGREAGVAVAIVEAAYRSTRSGKSEPVTLDI